MFTDRYDRDEYDDYRRGYADGVNDALDAALAVTEEGLAEALEKIEKTCNTDDSGEIPNRPVTGPGE